MHQDRRLLIDTARTSANSLHISESNHFRKLYQSADYGDWVPAIGLVNYYNY